jgi:hypothetical protein
MDNCLLWAVLLRLQNYVGQSILDYYFQKQKLWIDFEQISVGQHLGRFFSQTHPVTLGSML